MRKLITICLMMAMGFATNAQTKGPTKEQTITFIKDYFAEHQNISRTMSSRSSLSFTNIEVLFNDCYATVSWNSNTSYFDMTPDYLNKTIVRKSKVIVEFKNIESVMIRPYGNNNDNNEYQADLTLKAAPNTTFEETKTDKNGSKSISVKEVNIPVNSYSCSSCDHAEYSKKIQQAFNHLRKLCGAPEPISFD